MTGLYFHIPFCIRKCLYCAFDSLGQDCYSDSFVSRYIYALCREMKTASFNEEGRPAVDTIFFGGGTPSLLDPAAAGYILQQASLHFEISPDAEITLEANPGTVDRAKLARFRDAGVNRLSFGVQSFHDGHLERLGRIHNGGDAVRAWRAARGAGFENLSLDLIFAFPGQSRFDLEADLEKALALEPEHLSLYLFTPEEGTVMGDWALENREDPGEEESAAMMALSHDALSSAGYEHYELSNFCRRGYACRHNLKYWRYEEYRGFGSAACSFRNRWRYKNIADPHNYVYLTEHGWLPLEEGERLSREREMGEYAMLALRTAEGVDARRFSELFGREFAGAYGPEIETLRRQGLLESREAGFFSVPYDKFALQGEAALQFLR